MGPTACIDNPESLLQESHTNLTNISNGSRILLPPLALPTYKKQEINMNTNRTEGDSDRDLQTMEKGDRNIMKMQGGEKKKCWGG